MPKSVLELFNQKEVLNYLKERKQTVKSNMFNCLLNDNLLLEVAGNITNV